MRPENKLEARHRVFSCSNGFRTKWTSRRCADAASSCRIWKWWLSKINSFQVKTFDLFALCGKQNHDQCFFKVFWGTKTVSQIPPSGLLKFPCGHQSETLKKTLTTIIANAPIILLRIKIVQAFLLAILKSSCSRMRVSYQMDWNEHNSENYLHLLFALLYIETIAWVSFNN